MNKKRKIEYDITYMRMATALSDLSHAIRSKVGAIIVNNGGQIIGQGYNGTPSGFSNICEHYLDENGNEVHSHKYYELGNKYNKYYDEDDEFHDIDSEVKKGNIKACMHTQHEVLHAETNAISKCARFNSSTEGATIYVTLSPCFDCSKFIIQAGIKRVVYKELYRVTDGLDLLTKAGIICEMIDIDKKKIIRYEPNKDNN